MYSFDSNRNLEVHHKKASHRSLFFFKFSKIFYDLTLYALSRLKTQIFSTHETFKNNCRAYLNTNKILHMNKDIRLCQNENTFCNNFKPKRHHKCFNYKCKDLRYERRYVYNILIPT